MLKTMVLTLHGGLEVAFLIALLSAYLRGAGQRGLFPLLKWGVFFAIVVSLSLTYGVNSSWDREVVELTINGLAVTLTLALVAWVAWNLRRVPEQSGIKAGLLLRVFAFLGPAMLLVIPGLDIGLTQSEVFFGIGRLGAAELAAWLGAGLLPLVIAGAAGVTLYKATSQTRPKWVILMAGAALFVLFIRDATTAVQLMLVRGILPLTDWIFRGIVPLINNYGVYFYAFLGVMAALVITAAWQWRHREHTVEGLNPAQRRKAKAAGRRMAVLFSLTALLLALPVVSDSASAVLAGRPIRLAPATPIGAENGNVVILAESVSDGKLYRFAFDAEGVAVPFLMVYKGSGIYGVGLDACEICGPSGYRQDKENVICIRCNAAINKTTIGFPGGCNPIPLKYLVEDRFVVIPVEEIVAARTVFAQ